MIDIVTMREVSAITKIPPAIIILLFVVSLLAALLAGYSMCVRKKASLLHMVLFAAIIAVSFYVILDLESPRVGIIRLDEADVVLQNLLKTMQ